MSTRYVYSARLVPLDQQVNVPRIDGTPWYTSFNARAFVRTSERKIDVCVGHDLGMVVGRVVYPYTKDGWWNCDLVLDPELPNELEIGQAVSVGIDVLGGDDGVPFLREVSIVPRGNVEGAEITRRFAIEPKPMTRPAAKRTTSPSTVTPIRRSRQPRAVFPADELERRWNFACDLEAAGVVGAIEAEVKHMARLEQAMQSGRLPVLGAP